MTLDAKALEAEVARLIKLAGGYRYVKVHTDTLRSISSALPHAGKVSGEIVATGQFLLDRIGEVDWGGSTEEIWRDWDGHVEPAIARFRAALSSQQATSGGGAGRRASLSIPESRRDHPGGWIGDWLEARPVVPATSQAKGGALPDDLFSHKAAWRRGFERLRNAASDEQDWSYWQHELDAFDRVYAALVPATSQAKGGATVDALADFLCSEFDADFNPVVGAVWPEHPDDDGYRGDRAYVRLQPTDVQAHARDNARRILTFLGQRSLRSSSPVGQETAKEGE